MDRLPNKYPDAEIIALTAIPISRVYRTWERLTYWIRLGDRIRGCATIYSSSFLKRLGGYPDMAYFCDTYLLQKSRNTVLSDVKAYHDQKFSLRHAVHRQITDGAGRANLKYPLWKTILHSLVRVRPFVLLSYLYHRMS